jgi:peptide/nickel transport system substrate-binding protein
MKRKMNRRQLLKVTALGGVGATIAACAPAATPAPAAPAATTAPAATEAMAATEAPAATAAPAAAEATKAPEVVMGTVKPPVPYGDAPKLDVVGGEAKRMPINQIVTYKALDNYSEPDFVKKLVDEGKLPPVKDRLPKEPQVLLSAAMKDGPGEYGDLWRGFSACPTAGWNRQAGVSAGWFGIESYTTNNQSLFKAGPLFRADQDIEPFPNLAKSWSWSDDGMSLTVNLIEGAKWSDGQPFTADDVIFTWEGYVSDPNVNSGVTLDAFKYGDKDATLEKVDDYTLKFTFGIPKPLGVYYSLSEASGGFFVMPAHVLKSMHPKWSTANPKPSYKDFENALPADKLPVAVMGPWVPTEYKTDELLVMRRNPYYWKVDETGKQLPYFDEVQYKKGPSGIGRDLCTMAGDCDHTNLENPSSYVNTMTKAQDPTAKFAINWGPELLGYGVEFNYAEDLGTKDDRDKAVRQLNRNLKFRQALSYATDRDGIAQAIMRGPFLRGYAGGLYPGSPNFKKEDVVYYPYDPESAKVLLDEVGLKDTNGDGIREWTEGPMKGQPVVLQLLSSQDAQETQSVAEALVNQWAAVGIKLNTRVVDSTTRTDINTSATWDIGVYRGGQAYGLPSVNPTDIAPITKTFNMHREGDKPRNLLDFEKKLVDLIEKYRVTFDSAERQKIMSEYQKIFTENVYHMGVFSGRYGLGLAKRVKNIPVGTPTFLYTWVEDAILLDQLWTPKADQLKENQPDTIPTYSA